MTELIVNGQRVQLMQEPIPFRYLNPYLSERNGSILYSLKCRNTPVNAAIFGYPHRISGKDFGKVKSFEAVLLVNGLFFATGIVKISTANSSQFELSMGVDRGVLFAETQTQLPVLLKDVVLEMPDYEDAILRGYTHAFPDSKFAIAPVFNVQQYEGTDFYWLPAETDPAWAYQNAISYQQLLGDPTGFTIDGPHTPFFYVAYIIREVFAKLGYTITRNDFEQDAELATLSIYSNFLYRKWNAGGGVQKFNVANFMPAMTTYEFIRSIEILFNIAFLNDSNSRTVRIIKLDPIWQKPAGKDLTGKFGRLHQAEYKSKSSRYSFAFEGGSDNYFEQRVKQINDPYRFVGNFPELDDLPDPEDYDVNDVVRIDLGALVDIQANEWGYFACVIGPTANKEWRFYSADYLGETIDSGEQLAETAYSPKVKPVLPFQHQLTGAWSGSYIMTGRADVPCVANFSRNRENSFSSLRLFFYRGLHGFKDIPAWDTPLVSPERFASDGSYIPGADYELRWNGEHGLLAKFYANRLSWLKKFPVPVRSSRTMTLAELKSHSWEEPVLISGRNMLIGSIEGTVQPNGRVEAEYVLYPL